MAKFNSGNRYLVYDDSKLSIVEQGFSSRSAARMFKRELDYKLKAENQFRNTPSPYKVFTDNDHPRGSGIYLH